jgi:PAS domain S-box-containing protein
VDVRGAHEILDTAHNAVVSMDVAGRIVYWNPAAEAMFGVPRDAALGRVLADTIIPPRYREAHWQGLRRFLATGEGQVLGQRIELSALRDDRTEFPAEITISAQRDGDAWSFHAFIQDISERKAIEEERRSRVAQLETSLEGSEQRFEAIVGALAEAVTIRSPDDRIIYANPAALARLGFATVEQLRLADPQDIMADFIVEAEDGGPLNMRDVPSVRIFHGERPEPLLMRTVDRHSGVEQWLLLKATPLLDADGEIEATVTVIEDVTIAKRAEVRGRLLVRASQILGSSLDYQRTLRNVANLAVPDLADWCAVDLVDEQGRREQVVVAHADPARLSLAERIREFEPAGLDPEQGIGRVIATGEPELYSEMPAEMLRSAARDEEHLGLLLELGMRSVLIVPMNVAARTLGAITLVSAESGRRFGPSEVEFAVQVADRAAVAVENSRLYSERATIAETLQRSLLPDALPEIDGWDVAAFYRPAGGGLVVGGDFYDLFPVGDAWIALIGDVTGKGVQAAAMTSLLRHSARIVAEDDPDPARVLRRLDRALRERHVFSVGTALCARLMGDEVTFSLAGHPPPLLIREGRVGPIGGPGTMLGITEHGLWENHTVKLAPEETLLLYTDGIPDTVGEGVRFGYERLEQAALECAGQSAGELLACLDELLNRFQVGPQADDTAALALRLLPVHEPAVKPLLASPPRGAPVRRGRRGGPLAS